MQFAVAQRDPWLKIGHHLVEAGKVQRLAAIAPRFGRIGMHFHDHAIGARGHRNARQRGTRSLSLPRGWDRRSPEDERFA
jgi:hypothetical protein